MKTISGGDFKRVELPVGTLALSQIAMMFELMAEKGMLPA